jgi:hypothetical protein
LGRCSTIAPWPRPKAQASDFAGQHERRLRERLDDVLGGGTEW